MPEYLVDVYTRFENGYVEGKEMIIGMSFPGDASVAIYTIFAPSKKSANAPEKVLVGPIEFQFKKT